MAPVKQSARVWGLESGFWFTTGWGPAVNQKPASRPQTPETDSQIQALDARQEPLLLFPRSTTIEPPLYGGADTRRAGSRRSTRASRNESQGQRPAFRQYCTILRSEPPVDIAELKSKSIAELHE